MTSFRRSLLLVAVAGSLLAQMPEGPGRELTASVCGKCHGTDILAANRQTKDQWTETMFRMIGLGASASEEQLNTVLTYLAGAFGPVVRVNRASAAELERVAGLTAKEATAVVAYREARGPFKTAEDLKKVPGLEAARVENVKNSLSFE
jgi:competence protein ComEA